MNDRPLTLSLAPLAGYTDRAFRTLCKEGGADLVYSEMISATAVTFSDRKTFELAHFDECERPVILQLFGHEPKNFEYAARVLAERFSPEGFDINCGCPVPKVVKGGDGSALMRSPATIARIVEATRRAGLPVSVKLRTGIDDEHKNALLCARAAYEAGADSIVIHGRTREGGFSAPIDFETIAAVQDALPIPVGANGGITDTNTAREMLEKTGVRHLMIGRGALGNPYLFSKIRAELCGTPCDEPPLPELLARHLDLACAFKGERRALPEMRSHLAYYLKGRRGAARVRERLMRAVSRQEIDTVLEEFFAL